jgi:hypothetical protein
LFEDPTFPLVYCCDEDAGYYEKREVCFFFRLVYSPPVVALF